MRSIVTCVLFALGLSATAAAGDPQRGGLQRTNGTGRLKFVSHLTAVGRRQNAESKSSTPHLDRAVQTIRNQVGWFGEKPQPYARGFLAAVATMNYVQSRVSPLHYSLLAKAKRPLPTTPETYLAMRAGVCGGQVMTFREILTRLGVRNRPVEFYLRGRTPAENHNHIGAEVFYDQGWHFFDITWGTYFKRSEGADKRIDRVLSVQEVFATRKSRRLAITNHSDLWLQQWTASGLDPFEYLTASRMDLIVGRGGVITLRPTAGANGGQIYVPTHQPNYMGRNHDSPDFGSLAFRLMNVRSLATRCTVTVRGVAGAGTLVVRRRGDQVTQSLKMLTPGEHRIDISSLKGAGDLYLTVDSGNHRKIGYLVVQQINLDGP